MRFSINELQAMLGLSRSTILYYEERKILSPKRLKNGYREFSDEDMIRLKQIIVLRNVGLDVHAIERILQNEKEDAQAVFADVAQDLQKQIRRKTRLLSRVQEIVQADTGMPELVEAEPYLITVEPCCDVEHRFFSKSNVSQALIRSLGFSDIYFRIPEKCLEEGTEEDVEKHMEVNYRGISVDCAEETELDGSELRLCTPGICAHVWAKSTELTRKFCELRLFVKKHELLLNGDAYIRTPGFGVLTQSQGSICSEIFIPVKERE